MNEEAIIIGIVGLKPAESWAGMAHGTEDHIRVTAPSNRAVPLPD
jgi:hypothetical protein